VRLRNLDGTVGSEVLDVQFSSDASRLTAGDVDALRAGWDARHLLLVRGQAFSGEQQVAQPQSEHWPESSLSPGSPRHVHPVIGRHPRTGEPVVLANQMHSDRLVDVPAAQSEALLRDLFEVLYDPAHLLEHCWQVADTVLWDNVALHHGRAAPPMDEARTLQRVTLGDYTPAELVPDLAGLLARAKAGAR
jgi:alpha-ketoglutarate-dependent taurine dioxygenase